MSSLLLYLGVLALGVLVGSRKAVRAAKCRWIGPVQSAALVVLIFTLGVEIGSDERVFGPDANGYSYARSYQYLTEAADTLAALAGSAACVFLVRTLLGLDRQGRRRNGGEDERP